MAKKLRFLFTLLFIMAATLSWGEDYTYDFSTGGQYQSSKNTWTTDFFTILQEKGNSSTNVSGSYLTEPRWYQGHKITFTPANNIEISKIVINCNSSNYSGQTISPSIGSVSANGNNSIWTGNITSANPLVLTMGKQCRPTSIIVTYTTYGSSGPVDPDVSFANESLEIEVGSTKTNAINKPNDLTVSYSSSDGNVAIVDANGVVTGMAVGNATITASWGASDKYNEGSESYAVTVVPAPAMVQYQQVSKVSELSDGDEILFVSKDGTKAMSTTQNTNNRGSADVTADNGIISLTSNQTTVQVVKLEGSNSGWYFNVGNGYLQSASSSSNNLKTGKKNDYSKATINISSEETTIIFGGNYTRNHLRYNSSSDLFSCYASTSTMEEVFIYKKVVTSSVVAKPIFSVSGGTFFGPQSVEISCATEGATIKYSTDGENWKDYSSPIAIEQTTTLYAKAVKGEDVSDVATATYTFPTVYKTIAEFKTANTTGYLDLTGAQVVFIDSKKNNIYVRDDSGAIDLYNNSGFETELTAGDILSGIIKGTYTLYKNLPEITDIEDITKLTSSSNESVVAKEIEGTVSAIAANVCDLVKITKTTITQDGSNYYVGENVQLYDKFSANYNIETGVSADVVGIATIFNEAHEISPRTSADVVYYPAAPTFSLAAGSFDEVQTVTITAAEGTEIRYTTDGSDPNVESAKYENAITINEGTTTLKAVAVKDGLVSDVTSAEYTVTIPKAAQVGDETYRTFADAVAALTETNNVITLLANVEEAYTLAANQVLNVKLNGFTLTVNAPENYLLKTEVKDGVTTYSAVAPVAQIGEVKYETLAAAVAAATEGQTVKVIKAGGYTLPNLPKNITIEGAEETEVLFTHTTAGSIASVPNGATFKNVKFEFGNVNYHGFQHAGTINMEGCTLSGKLFSYGDMNFTNCQFTQTNSDYHMWTYAGNVTYTNCTFTNEKTGKFINVYNESGATKYTITATNCKFINKEGNAANKAAVNVKATSDSNLLAYDVIINNCATEGAFPEASSTDALVVLNSVVQVDDRTADGVDNIKVWKDGVQIYPYIEPAVVSAPVVFHDSGEYEAGLSVPMYAQAGAKIYYTTNGSEPTTASTEYNGALTIEKATTLKAIAVLDGVASAVVTREYTIKAAAAEIEAINGYYSIKNGTGKYINVAGRKTVTFTDAIDDKAGTVLKVKINTNGQVEELRSQGVDLPGYADRAMNYVPKFVKLIVDKLHAEGSGEILGEHGLDAIMQKFNDSFDYHLYVEKADADYRIYGKTPSMKPVVDFYAENKDNVDYKLPQLEAFINSAIQKVLQKTGGRGASILTEFKLHDIWQKMGETLTEPVEDDAASIAKFYEEVLASEANVWNFAYQTAMIYWNNVKSHPRYEELKGKLGEYANYIEKVENIQPDFKYYIVGNTSGNDVDFISEGNIDIQNNAARTIWTMNERNDYKVTFTKENSLNIGRELYTTLYVDFAYTLPETVKAYKVTAIDEKTGLATKEEISGVIPAQTPVLLQMIVDPKTVTDADLTQTLTLSTEAGTAVTDNLLQGPDWLINKYQIKAKQVEELFGYVHDALKMVGVEALYDSYVKEYEYLMIRNAGTVNNKYFFGLSGDDIADADVNVCQLAKQGDTRKRLAFYHNLEKVDANKAFIPSEKVEPVYLSLIGDVNRDGKVNITDVTCQIDIVLDKDKPEDNYDYDAADLDFNDDVTISDVTDLIDVVLGKKTIE